MGCDIHIVLERKRPDSREWIGVYTTDKLPGGRPKIARRDYEFFARVAAVRGTVDGSVYPKNLPEDVSDLAWQEYMRAPTDHHSASYMPISQFVNAWIAENEKSLGGVRPECAVYDLLGVDTDERFEFRVVFWFDN